MVLEDGSTAQIHPELEQEDEVVLGGSDDRPVKSSTKDWPVSSLRDKYERNQIDLQPEYQRGPVWESKPELQSRLIESLLLHIPIPPIYFGKITDSRFEVIDGQQRLRTFIRFVRNEFALQRLQRMPSLNGKLFKDLSEDYQSRILDAEIRSVVIDIEENGSLRYEVFERLNRGSMALNEQELRNCVYRGPFCNLLAKLEKNGQWRKVKGTDAFEPRFAEREMILRFFAFANRINHYRGNLKRFLNEYMAIHAPQDPAELARQEEMFIQTMRNIYTVFGKHSGNLYSARLEDNFAVDGRWEGKFSVSALDIQASALLDQPHAKVQAAQEQIREAYIFYLLTNPQVRHAISYQPASTDATKTRWSGFKSWVQEILNGTTVEPRFFPFALRRQLYETNPTCQLCGNEIHTFDDSTVDHIHPYSKGGKTIPTNAQLAHRSCNARKWANSDALPSSPFRQQSLPVVNTGSTPGLVNPPQQTEAATKRSRSLGLKLSKQHDDTSMNDLIRAGIVVPPLALEKTLKGQRLTASVQHDGRINFNGRVYDALSSAAYDAVGLVNGSPSQQNGWRFWQFRDGYGQLQNIDALRQRYRNR